MIGIKEDAMPISLRCNRRDVRRLVVCAVLLSVCATIILTARYGRASAEKANHLSKITTTTAFDHPTASSPIALSADNRLVWVVNPKDDSVSVIRTDQNVVIAKITVGDEPEG